MQILRSFRVGWALLMAAQLLTACGGAGGGDAPDRAPLGSDLKLQALTAAEARLTSATASTPAVTSDMALDWAEFKYPQLFPKALRQTLQSVVYQGVNYNARAYAGPWGTRYLGVTSDGRIHGLGDFTSMQLQQFETVAFWSAQILADPCAVSPASCNRKPVAVVQASQRSFVGTETTLDGAASYDPEGQPLSFRWNLTSRPAGSTAQVARDTLPASRLTVDVAGTYRLTLVVNDKTQDSDPVSIVITAVDVPTSGLYINASRDLASRSALESIFFGPLFAAWNPTSAGGPGMKIMMFGTAHPACPGGTVGAMAAFPDAVLSEINYPGVPSAVPTSMRFQPVTASACGFAAAGFSGPSRVFLDTTALWLSTASLGASTDLLRPFNASGQNNSGNNVNILNTSVNFRLSGPVTPVRPWAGSGVARLATSASTVQLTTTGGSTLNQAKQQVSLQLGNSACRTQFPGRLCALEWLFAIAISQSDVSDWSKVPWAQGAATFGDPVQGGMPVIDVTLIPRHGEPGLQRESRLEIFTSRGEATQHTPFDRRTFAVEISAEQLKNALRALSARSYGEPVPTGETCAPCERLFGARWNDPSAWVVDEVRNMQEIYDTTARSARVTGSVGWLYIGPAP